ncbi:MAG: EAL domain-containing protein [Candidatus Rariloculaceae bacterium]
MLGRYGASPDLIEIEVTEGTLMRNTDGVQDALRKLKMTGVRLSVDDFGTGQSARTGSHLQRTWHEG